MSTTKFKQAVLGFLKLNPHCVLIGSLALWEPGATWQPKDANLVYVGTSTNAKFLFPAVDRDTLALPECFRKGMSLAQVGESQSVTLDASNTLVNFVLTEYHPGDKIFPLSEQRKPLGKCHLLVSGLFPTAEDLVACAHLTCCRIACQWDGSNFQTITGKGFSRTHFRIVEDPDDLHTVRPSVNRRPVNTHLMRLSKAEHRMEMFLAEWNAKLDEAVQKHTARGLELLPNVSMQPPQRTIERCRALASQTNGQRAFMEPKDMCWLSVDQDANPMIPHWTFFLIPPQ